MLPPAPLFESLAYQLCPRSVKSWWWRLTAWRIFTPPQKKEQLISERVKGPLCAKIRSPLIKALDRSVETVDLWIVTSRLLSVHFTVMCLVAKPLNRSEAEDDLVMIKKTMLLLKCKWLCYHANLILVFITTWSTSAWPQIKGLAIKYTTVKWPMH